MTIEQDFLPYAVGGSANVLSQSAYAALTSLLQNGLTSGIVPSNQLNKTMRQSSVMAAVLAQFIVDGSGQPAIDDGTTATLETNLIAAIRSVTKTGVILADTGAANAYTAVNVPPLVAGTWIDGVVQQVKIAHANTGASTYAPDGLTAIPIYGLGLQPLQGGELALNGTAVLMHATIPGVNSGNPIAVLMECAGGAQQIAPATASQHAVQMGQVAGVVGSTRNAAMDLTAASASATFTADEIVVESALGGLRYCLSSFSQVINLATTGAGGMDTGTAPVSGYVALYAIYKPSTGTTSILATNATASAVPNVYAGGNMPAGYTASALISVWPTNASSQFVVGTQFDRTVAIAAVNVLNTSVQQGAIAAVSISGAVPRNAKRISGFGIVSSSVAAQCTFSVAANGTSVAGLQQFTNGANGIGAAYNTRIGVSQTMYYTATVASGTMTFSLNVSEYSF